MGLKLIHISKRGSWNPSSALKRDCLSHIVNFMAFNYHAQNGPFIARYRLNNNNLHDDVIKWKHFPRNWPFVREIHRSPVNFPHKGQWRGALMFSLIYAWINDWVNNREAGDLRRQHGHYDVIVMLRRVWSTTLSMGDVTTKYLKQLKSYSRRQMKYHRSDVILYIYI